MKTSKNNILLIVNKRNEVSFKIMNNLASGFLQNGHEVEVISNDQRLTINRFVKKIIDEMYNKKYDIMISSSKLVTLALLVLLKFRQHKPIIFTFDSKDITSNHPRLNIQIKKALKSFANRWNYVIKFSKKEDDKSCESLNLPFIDKTVGLKYKKKIDHRWYGKGYQVLVSKGDITKENDYKTIILALYELLKVVETRLIIIGSHEKDKSESFHLIELIEKLGLSDYVDFQEDSENTFSFISNASLYISVTNKNKFPEEIVHVLGCGTPVISLEGSGYDKNILDNGRYGTLLKSEDFMGLTEAIKNEMSKVHYPILLVRRAIEFSVEKWIRFFENLLIENTEQNIIIEAQKNINRIEIQSKTKRVKDG
ncbi:MAG: glycosyltransferase [Melioribacteraceae bacterium]|nr:glycosyltransferase [Melioribacteraceae bacterium]